MYLATIWVLVHPFLGREEMLKKKSSQCHSRNPCRLRGSPVTPTWLPEVLFSLPMVIQGAQRPFGFDQWWLEETKGYTSVKLKKIWGFFHLLISPNSKARWWEVFISAVTTWKIAFERFSFATCHPAVQAGVLFPAFIPSGWQTLL